MENKDLEKLFSDPTNEYRGKPFWSWNGKLEKEELMRQIQVVKDMGMGGFFCHSRTGLETEYLGDEWFDLINASADKGEELGLEAWLYDEDRWPSGTAGGMVTKDPEYRLKYMRLTIIDKDDIERKKSFIWGRDVIAAFSADVDGILFKNKKIINTFDELKAQNGDWLIFTVEEMVKSDFYNGFTYVDTMNHNAVKRFMELTYEGYAKNCGDRLVKSIKGIFTDEPHRGAVMCSTGITNENSAYIAPYTNILFERFYTDYGYKLEENLPELFLFKNGENTARIKWQYMNLLQNLFIENYFIPINNWCNEHNIKFTGHILHEDSLTAQAVLNGSVMRVYEHMGYPGVDVLTEHNRSYWIVKQLSSVARQLDKKWLLSELYGLSGWQADFQSHKTVGDWQALLGINVRCHHLSWYTMKGEAKRDYPASIFYQSAWYKEYKYVEDYFSRINVFMLDGTPVCDVLVINPVESVWTMIHPGWACWLDASDDHIRKLQNIYENTFKILMGLKIDFDYGDEEIIAKYGCLEKEKGESYIRVGASRYSTVVISGMVTMRKSTLDLIERFKEAGGNVVCFGDRPSLIDAKPEKSIFMDDLQSYPLNCGSVRETLKGCETLSMFSDENEDLSEIYAQAKKDGNVTKYFLLNANRDKQFKKVKIYLKESGYIKIWGARSGEKTDLGYKAQGEFIDMDFAPGEELLFTISKEGFGVFEKKDAFLETVSELPDSMDFVILEKNVCVLDIVNFKADDDDWVKDTEILKADRHIRAKYNMSCRGGEMLQPWFRKKTKYDTAGKIILEFEFFIEDIPQDINLAMETPEDFDVFLNGYSINTKNTLGTWVDNSIILIEIDRNSLKTGKNTVRLECGFSERINLEALYLIGNFGVKAEGLKKTLTKLPETLNKGSITEQGLVFYSGAVGYKVRAPEISEGQILKLAFEGFGAACIKVACGNKEKILAFRPFSLDISEFAGNEITIYYVLTRRNTFGPLHEYPEIVGGYGPGNFVTDGDRFLYNRYGIIDAGMTKPVRFEIWSFEK